jgi:hypothetical protein
MLSKEGGCCGSAGPDPARGDAPTFRVCCCDEENLTQVKAARIGPDVHYRMEWRTPTGAPFDRDLELAVIDYYGVHSLVFPCRRILTGWIDSETGKQIDLRPTHWREWRDQTKAFPSPPRADR